MRVNGRLPLVVFAGLYFLLNTGLVAAAITLDERGSLFAIGDDRHGGVTGGGNRPRGGVRGVAEPRLRDAGDS